MMIRNGAVVIQLLKGAAATGAVARSARPQHPWSRCRCCASLLPANRQPPPPSPAHPFPGSGRRSYAAGGGGYSDDDDNGGGYGDSRRIEIVVDPRGQSQRKSRAELKRERRRRGKNGGKVNRRRDYFVDRTRLVVRGGDGGKGSLSMQPLRQKRKLKADGGHGGSGGHVVLVADPKCQGGLSFQQHHIQAEKGSNGQAQRRSGRNGKNRIVRVPCGVVVKRVLMDDDEDAIDYDDHDYEGIPIVGDEDDDDGEDDDENDYDVVVEDESKVTVELKGTDGGSQFQPDSDDEGEVESSPFVNNVGGYAFYDLSEGDEVDDGAEGHLVDERDDRRRGRHRRWERNAEFLADLDQPGSHVLVARGGRGGYGSCLYASHHGPLPAADVLIRAAQPEQGEVLHLELELKLIADVGLVGFPNAGKSSLLCAMSRARPKVAPYPFTTLRPILGCVEYRDGFRVRVADVPGLIEGASYGRGKGHDFLRHVERTKALLYMVDAAGVDGRSPVDDLVVLADEVDSYSGGNLLARRALVVANKLDLLGEDRIPEVLHEIGEAARDIGINIQRCDDGEGDGDGGDDVLGISAGVTGQGLAELSKAIRNVVIKTDEDKGTATTSGGIFAATV